ncbi:MAG: rhomboid family intramembrane serine protease [Acidobacteriota bacterium]
MLIPIGHDEDGVRRLPWVTITIIVICVALHVVDTFQVRDLAEDAQEAYYEAIRYYNERPYLDPPEQLDVAPPAMWGIGSAEQFDAAMDELGPSRTEQRREQQRLEELVQAWLDKQNDHPAWSRGVVPGDFQPLTLLTSMFTHADWSHLLFNMFFLWLVGPPLEDIWGRPFFAGFYILAGVVGSVIWIAAHPQSMSPLIGASGAIAGVMGAFAVRYWKTKMKIFYFFWIILRIFTGVFEAPAWVVLGMWFAGEVFNTLIASAFGVDSGVAFLVHVAGFVVGLNVAVLISVSGFEKSFLAKQVEKTLGPSLENPTIDEAHALRDQGKLDEAWNLVVGALAKEPNNIDLAVMLWDLGGQRNTLDKAVKPFMRAMAHEARRGDAHVAAGYFRDLRHAFPDIQNQLDFETKTRLAEATAYEEDYELATELLSGIEYEIPDELPIGPRIHLARAAAIAQPPNAAPLIQQALEREIPPDVHADLEDSLIRINARNAFHNPNAAPVEHREFGAGDEIIPLAPVSDPQPAQPEPDVIPLAPIPGDAGAALPPITGAQPPGMASQAMGFAGQAPISAGAVPPPAGGVSAGAVPPAVATPIQGVTHDPDIIALKPLGNERAQPAPGFVPPPLPPNGDQLGSIDGALGGSPPPAVPHTAPPRAPQPPAAPPMPAAPPAAPPVQSAPPAAPPSFVVDELPPLGDLPALDAPPAKPVPPPRPAAPAAQSFLDPTPPAAPPQPAPRAASLTPPQPSAPRAVAPPAAAPPAVPAQPAAMNDRASFQTRPVVAAATPGPKLVVYDAVPQQLTAEKIRFQVPGQGARALPLAKINAVAAAEINGVVVIDLVMDPPRNPQRLRTVRMRSDQFQAQTIVGEQPDPIRFFITYVLRGSKGQPLPDAAGVTGQPFRNFPSIAQYETQTFGRRSGK